MTPGATPASDLREIAQALERAPQRAPFPAVPVLLSGALAFGAGLTVGWMLWGL
jgi:hypothetical protein